MGVDSSKSRSENVFIMGAGKRGVRFLLLVFLCDIDM